MKGYGFSYCRRHCKEFGIIYVPDASHLGERMGEYEIMAVEIPGRDGGYYYGAR